MEAPLSYSFREASEKSDAPCPAIFLLHGYGSNRQDLFSLGNEFPEKYHIFSLEAPYKMYNDGFAWYALELGTDFWFDLEQAQLSQRKILDFVAYATEKYRINTEKSVLLGFSQGAILGLSLALSFPNKITKVVALSGYLEPKILTENFEKNDFSKLKIYTSHGLFDQIVPLEWAKQTPKILNPLQISLTYQEFPSGHTISMQNFNEILRWLSENE